MHTLSRWLEEKQSLHPYKPSIVSFRSQHQKPGKLRIWKMLMQRQPVLRRFTRVTGKVYKLISMKPARRSQPTGKNGYLDLCRKMKMKSKIWDCPGCCGSL